MKRLRPKSNHHHLIPRSRGGQGLNSNIIFIHTDKHDAWHKLWDFHDHACTKPRTLGEIINLLKKLPYYFTPCSQEWRTLWKQKSAGEVLEILYRLRAIKDAQKKKKWRLS
jgi:hypothetical protein